MDRIGITGATGQLGSSLLRRLGDQALPLGREVIDLSRPDEIAERLARFDLQAIINCAAYTQVDAAERDEANCHTINALGPAALAAVCAERNLPLVQLSTDYVFGGQESLSRPWREDDPAAPQGVYARSKLAGEQQVASVAPRHLIVRTCGLYADTTLTGPARNFVNTMLRLGAERDEVRVVADQRCTPSYTPDVAGAILELLARNAVGIYHVTNAGDVSWHEFTLEIFRLASIPARVAPITTAEFGAPAPRPRYSVLDTSKYQALVGAPLPCWQTALAGYLQSRRPA